MCHFPSDVTLSSVNPRLSKCAFIFFSDSFTDIPKNSNTGKFFFDEDSVSEFLCEVLDVDEDSVSEFLYEVLDVDEDLVSEFLYEVFDVDEDSASEFGYEVSEFDV